MRGKLKFKLPLKKRQVVPNLRVISHTSQAFLSSMYPHSPPMRGWTDRSVVSRV